MSRPPIPNPIAAQLEADLELVVEQFNDALYSTEDVYAHPETVGGEPYIAVHHGSDHIVTLPRNRFIQAMYRETTDLVNEAAEPERRPLH
jgi:hypothetical protein